MRVLRRLGFVFLWGFCGVAHADVVGEAVEYRAGDVTLNGYIAWDDAIKGQRPGILVVHEWWGHNEYVRRRARMLAEEGFTALAVDMYGGGKLAQHPKDAGRFAGEVRNNMTQAEARFKAAMEVLAGHETVGGQSISAIGYCFGGGMVLAMARRGLDLDVAASFHGSLATDSPAEKGTVKARLFVANGADDPLVKPEHVDAFRAEMDRADVVYRFIDYPGAKHAFTNPDADRYGKEFGLPLAYNKEADSASWDELLRWLRR